MRKIETKEATEKRQTRNKVIIAVIFIGLMVLSTAGFALFSGNGITEKSSKKYNDVEFKTNDNGYWEFKIQGQSFQTSFTPEETESISADAISISELSGKPIYFVNSDPASANEILYNIGRYATRYQDVCLKDLNCTNSDNIVKTCDDNLIVFKESDEDSVKRDNNCLFINYSPGNEVLVGNRLIFKALGVQ